VSGTEEGAGTGEGGRTPAERSGQRWMSSERKTGDGGERERERERESERDRAEWFALNPRK